MTVFHEDPFQRIVGIHFPNTVLLAVVADMVWSGQASYSDVPHVHIPSFLDSVLWSGTGGPLDPYTSHGLLVATDSTSTAPATVTVIDKEVFFWGYTVDGVRSGNIGDITGIRHDGISAEQDALNQARTGYASSPFFGNPDDVWVTPDPFQAWQTESHEETITVTTFNSHRKELVILNVAKARSIRSDISAIFNFGPTPWTLDAALYRGSAANAFDNFANFLNGSAIFPGLALDAAHLAAPGEGAFSSAATFVVNADNTLTATRVP
jgi:hypothetical protein